MSVGFSDPPAGAVMCRYPVVYGTDGRLLERSRSCRRAATHDSTYCALHARIAAKHPEIVVREGGFCVCCAEAARSYVDVESGVSISLCRKHCIALARAIRDRNLLP